MIGQDADEHLQVCCAGWFFPGNANLLIGAVSLLLGNANDLIGMDSSLSHGFLLLHNNPLFKLAAALFPFFINLKLTMVLLGYILWTVRRQQINIKRS